MSIRTSSPVSRTGSDFFASGHPVRLTVIESLDTLYLMEADEELNDGVDFVVNDLSFDINANFQVFEAIIRVVGGLLSGYHASRHPGVLAKARDLADRLMPAFELGDARGFLGLGTDVSVRASGIATNVSVGAPHSNPRRLLDYYTRRLFAPLPGARAKADFDSAVRGTLDSYAGRR